MKIPYKLPLISPPANFDWNLRKVRDVIMVVVVSSYFLSALSWAMPPNFPFKGYIDRKSHYIFEIFGLWQAWNMFAPDPCAEDIYVSVKFEYPNGEERVQPLTRMIDMPLGKRVQRERWRKYFNDNLISSDNPKRNIATARWFANMDLEDGRSPIRVELFKSWRRTKLPVNPELRPGQLEEPWQVAKIITYNVSLR